MIDSLAIKRITDDKDFPPPQRRDGDAAWDLRSTIETALLPGEQMVIPTGFAWRIPSGYAGFLWPRSGLAAKLSIDRRAGLIDENYRGEVGAVIRNDGDEPFFIHRGDRIIQMVIGPVFPNVPLNEVDELPDSNRGDNGYGSSGVS